MDRERKIRLTEVLTKLPTSRHISFTSAKDVQDIFLECFKDNNYIKSFGFTRYFNDGSRAVLYNNCEDLKFTYYSDTNRETYHHLQHLHGLNRIFMSHLTENLTGGASRGYEEYLVTLKENFKLQDLFYIIKQNIGYIDSFVFGVAGKPSNIITYIMNAINNIEFFCDEFYKKGKYLIERASQELLVLPWCEKDFSATPIIKSRKHNSQGFSLSLQEKRVSELLIQGKTAKEIGRVYELSYRTVEHYIDNIKKKYAVSTRTELVYFLTKAMLQQGVLQ